MFGDCVQHCTVTAFVHPRLASFLQVAQRQLSQWAMWPHDSEVQVPDCGMLSAVQQHAVADSCEFFLLSSQRSESLTNTSLTWDHIASACLDPMLSFAANRL